MKNLNQKMILSMAAVVTLGVFSGLAVSKGTPTENQTEKQWYLSNTVSVYDANNDVTHHAINPAVFGKLFESDDGYDKHDVTPYVSLANAKAAVLFVRDDWGDRSGEYHSDYHGSNRQSDSWLMTVVSTVTDAEVTLSWDGLFELTSNESNDLVSYTEKRTLDSQTLVDLHLIDLDTLEVIEAVSDEGLLNSHSFYLASGETSRHFRWVLGPIKSSYFDSASHTKRYIKEQQRELARQQRDAESGSAKNDKFGLPPNK